MTNSFSKMLSETPFTVPIEAVLFHCYFNAFHNQRGRYKDLNLKVVIGSLGLAGHFEYGGKHHTRADFYKNPLDSHAWLEDDKGNVYDYIFPQYAEFARTWGKKPTFATNWEICGMSKKELAEDGLEYIPCPKLARPDLINNIVAIAKARDLEPWVIKGVRNM
jgi:hypothetical protein